jgi:hypothetical protein
MTFNYLPLFLLTVFWAIPHMAQVNPDSLIHIEVLGNDTDPWINGDLGKKHQVFYNPTSNSNHTLLLHLVGSIDNPNSTTYYPIEATNHGFHVINLMYKNWTSAQSACAESTDPDCYLNFRKEIIEGIDYSSETNVSAGNSIENRLLKLLIHLNTSYPNHDWNEFYTGTTIHWDKLMVSGHSQGGGHAAVIGISKPIKRVIMFASPNDYSDTLNSIANWLNTTHIVADSNYYGFNALYDDVVEYWQQHEAWDALGMTPFGDTVNVDFTAYPYNSSRQLYTKEIVPNGGLEDLTHNVMIRDSQTPLNGANEAVFLPVWKYLLGIVDSSAETEDHLATSIAVYPNPARDKITLNYKDLLIEEAQIYDLQGRLVLTTNQPTTIDISSLKPGNYLVHLITNKGKTVIKTVKQ